MADREYDTKALDRKHQQFCEQSELNNVERGVLHTVCTGVASPE